MRATYVALQEHGYAGLSIGRIADEADLSKSTFYHHYDDREDLLLSFLEYMLEEFMRLFSAGAGSTPRERLETFLDLLMGTEFPPDGSGGVPPKDNVLRTYVQLRGQAAGQSAFREKFTETDLRLREQLAYILRSGIEEGAFRDVDPEATAEFVLTLAAGNIMRRATRDETPSGAVRETLDDYLAACVYREE
jgi:AcrR family transcriptional regulator